MPSHPVSSLHCAASAMRQMYSSPRSASEDGQVVKTLNPGRLSGLPMPPHPMRRHGGRLAEREPLLPREGIEWWARIANRLRRRDPAVSVQPLELLDEVGEPREILVGPEVPGDLLAGALPHRPPLRLAGAGRGPPRPEHNPPVPRGGPPPPPPAAPPPRRRPRPPPPRKTPPGRPVRSPSRCPGR